MSYDSLSNRTSDSNSTYLFDESKQLIKEDYKFQYVFDPNGNMTSKIEKGFTGNVENFDYTSENQLKTFRLYESGVLTKEVQYLHDALGRRIEKTVVNHKDNHKSYTKRFAYDGQEILFEMDGKNTITKTYTHSTLRTDDVLGVAIENNSYFFLKDGLGTITDIVDSNGFVKQHYEYSVAYFARLEIQLTARHFASRDLKTSKTRGHFFECCISGPVESFLNGIFTTNR